MIKCETCNSETSNQRFCSLRCTVVWNNKHSMTEETQRSRGKKNSQGTKIPNNLLDMSSRTVTKLIRRMNIGCSVCGWKDALCDIHHIVPRRKGGTNDNNNLTILCPNHHRLIHEGAELPIKSVTDHIGEEWRKHYYAHE